MEECALRRECFFTTSCAIPGHVVGEGEHHLAHSYLASSPFENLLSQMTFRRVLEKAWAHTRLVSTSPGIVRKRRCPHCTMPRFYAAVSGAFADIGSGIHG